MSVDEFFDAHYLVRNLASLFGIPAHRLKVPKIVLTLTLALTLTRTLTLTPILTLALTLRLIKL